MNFVGMQLKNEVKLFEKKDFGFWMFKILKCRKIEIIFYENENMQYEYMKITKT